MRTHLFPLAALLLKVGLAGEISPEARAFLAELRAPLQNLRSLSWELQDQSGATRVRGWYKQGGSVTLVRGAGLDTETHVSMGPDGLVRYAPAQDRLIQHWAGSPAAAVHDLWFILPLIHERALVELGDVSLRMSASAGKQLRVLVLAWEKSPESGPETPRFEFFYDGTRLVKYTSLCWRTLRTFCVTKYHDVRGCSLPVSVQEWSDTRVFARHAANLMLGPGLGEATLPSVPEKVLTIDASLTPDQLAARLKAATTPKEKASLHLTRGFLYEMKSRDLARAIEHYRLAAEDCPASRAGHAALASALVANEQHVDAARAYEAMLRRLPGSVDEVCPRLIRLYRSGPAKDLDVALRVANRWVRERPDSYRARREIAGVLATSSRTAESIAAYEAAIAAPDVTSWDKARCRLHLARRYRRSDRTGDAERTLMGLIAEADVVADATPLRLGDKLLLSIYREQGRLDEAISLAVKAQKASPDNPGLLRWLAVLCRAKGDHQAATKAFEELISLEPTSFLIYHKNLLQLYHRTGQQDKQFALYERIFDSHPELMPKYFLGVHEPFKQAGQERKAEKFIADCLRAHPENAKVLSALARFRWQHGRKDEAIGLYRKAILFAATDYDRGTRRLTLAHACIETGRRDEAVAVLKAAMESGVPFHQVEAGKRLAELLRQLIDFRCPHRKLVLPELTDLYGRLVRLDPTERNYRDWIRALGMSGRKDERARAQEEFTKRFPRQPESLRASPRP